MKVAVVGGGINGIMSAWALVQAGHSVTVFEMGELMSATSSSSTKLLHGGLRYLEQGKIGLVREALQERMWWLEHAPQLAHPLKLVFPVYRHSPRSKWVVQAGLVLYDLLAGSQKLGAHEWHDAEALASQCPELSREGLRGGFAFFDGQMDDKSLGLWAADLAAKCGVEFWTNVRVDRVSRQGDVVARGTHFTFDRIVNVAGPWAKRLLDESGVDTQLDLDLVRGSHLVLRRQISLGYVLQVPGEERICFALPYQGKTLLGTTEVRQGLDEPIGCSESEREYLLRIFNHYLRPAVTPAEVESTFAGVRPLIRSSKNPSRATREYAMERSGRLITVFGGKWTTSRVLGQKVARLANRECRN